MEIDLAKTIRELSEIYDKNSQDTFISLYINKISDPKFIQRREKACFSLLKKDEKENFLITIDKIKEYLKSTNYNKLAIFASDRHQFFKAIPLSVDIYNALIVDSSPYVRPLARILDEWESFTLVLLDSHYAKLYSISLGKIDYQKNISKDIMNKHRMGGMSQARYQRLRKGAIHDFFKDTIEALDKIDDKKIIIAGPGPAKIQFKEILPKHLSEKVVDLVDISIDNEKDLLERSLKIISEKENNESHVAVQHLKEEILKDGLAVYGLDETLKAAKNGQIELLIVEKDYKLKGCLCENCQILKAGPVKDCPVCGGPTTEADVIEEIIEFAQRTDAHIEFTDDELISELGHVGAILRYK